MPYLTKLPELSRVIGDNRGHMNFADMTDVRRDELERLKSLGVVAFHHDEFGALRVRLYIESRSWTALTMLVGPRPLSRSEAVSVGVGLQVSKL